MSKSNSFSILQTLIARGYVADEGDGMTRRYRLTPALAQLADGALGKDSITTIGQKILEALTARAIRGSLSSAPIQTCTSTFSFSRRYLR